MTDFRSPWSNRPTRFQPPAPPAPNSYQLLVAKEILAASDNDPIKFLAITSSEPSYSAVGYLPGSSPAEKADYFVTYLEACYAKGLSAWDVLQGKHDNSALITLRPTRVVDPADRSKNVRITNPYEAADFNFPESDYDSQSIRRLADNFAEDQTDYEKKLARYQALAAKAPV